MLADTQRLVDSWEKNNDSWDLNTWQRTMKWELTCMLFKSTMNIIVRFLRLFTIAFAKKFQASAFYDFVQNCVKSFVAILQGVSK